MHSDVTKIETAENDITFVLGESLFCGYKAHFSVKQEALVT